MLLSINNLNISFPSERGSVEAVKNVSLHIAPGETLGLVGESGSGKSVTALSILQLLPASARVTGEVLFEPSSKIPVPNEKLRGREIAMIFQEPMTSLNPVFRCGAQVTEAIRLHHRATASEARDRVLALFEKVRLPDPVRIFQAYPHELSGGQKQRVLIAMALAGQPRLLIADEPTTALDVTVQKAILSLLRDLRDEAGLSMLFISHDLGVISEIADRVAVMRHGEFVESGTVQQVLTEPAHPYTQGLLACRPSLHRKVFRLPTVQDFLEPKNGHAVRTVSPEETAAKRADIYAHTPLLEVKNLSVRYPVRGHFLSRTSRWVEAVRQVEFDIYPGEIFGLAGESGCGKTTLGRVVNRLLAPSEGSVWYRRLNMETLTNQDFRNVRREIQMVFQDPYSSLNPRMTIGDAILEPMQAYQLHGSERQRREAVAMLLEKVGLEPGHAGRFPREFSGGQRQRICLARALALQPKLLVCDEIVSALDVSVQAGILNLLLDLQRDFGLTYLFISHDLSVIRQMCDRVLVLSQGRMEALGHPEVLFEQSDNVYMRALVEAVPVSGLFES